jgi:hypothetical protein
MNGMKNVDSDMAARFTVVIINALFILSLCGLIMGFTEINFLILALGLDTSIDVVPRSIREVVLLVFG